MPRTPRNPGSGKPPHNGPAKGVGHGGPARGGPAAGAGYGGPPNPGDRPPKAFTRDSARELAGRIHSPDKVVREAAHNEMRRLSDERIIWAMAGADYDPLLGVRVSAAETARARIDGKAMQHVKAQVDANTSTVPDLSGLSDDEVRKGAELFRELRQIEARAHAGRQQPGADAGGVLPAGLADVVRDGA